MQDCAIQINVSIGQDEGPDGESQGRSSEDAVGGVGPVEV